MEPRGDEFQLERRRPEPGGSEPGGPMRFERPMDGDVMIAMAESFGWRFFAPDAVFISVGTLRKVPLALSVSGALIARPAWHAALALTWAVLLVAFLLVARGPLSAVPPAV